MTLHTYPDLEQGSEEWFALRLGMVTASTVGQLIAVGPPDPLDVMCCVSEATFPGCMIDVKPIALFRMEDDQGIDAKVLCVPLSDPGWNTMEKLEDLPDLLTNEITHFFSIYKTPEWKVVKVDGWYPREEALESIERAKRRFREPRA